MSLEPRLPVLLTVKRHDGDLVHRSPPTGWGRAARSGTSEQRGWPFRYCCLGVSSFANTAALFERARQLGVNWRLDEDMGIAQMPEIQAMLAHFLAEVDHVYFTICLDVLPASVMPGVSAPAAHGVTLDVVEAVADMVCDSDKLRLADIAELNPVYDVDHRSARVAARLLARIANNMSA